MKTKQTFIHRLGKNSGGFMMEHYYDEDISNDLYAVPHYMWSMRYVWLRYDENHKKNWRDLISEDIFDDGYGWYSFVQTGPRGLYSPFIAALVKCRGRNEAYRVASRRSVEKISIDNDQLDLMRARHSLLGG